MRKTQKITVAALVLALIADAVPGMVGNAAAYEEKGKGQHFDRGRFPRTIAFKQSPGDGMTLVSSDALGELRMTGLEPGDYEIWPLRLTAAAPVRNAALFSVSPDGRIALALREATRSDDGAVAGRSKPNDRSLGTRIESIAFEPRAAGLPGGGGVIDLRQVFQISPPVPCAYPGPGKPNTCGYRSRNHIDVNASPAEEITRLAPQASPSAVAAIVDERSKNGAFRDVIDFAQRLCARTAIDFGDVSLRLGSTSVVVQRGGDPKANGFRCAAGTRTFDMLGQKHNYVGHVTLLR